MVPMGRELTRNIDAFAAGLEELIGDIPAACAEKGGEAVEKSVRKTAKELRSGTYGSSGKHEWSKEYMSGFSSHVEHGMETVGEVGNKNKPGLVHLLEKGHLTLTGRRTTAYPHMAPAFDAMANEFVEEYKKAIGAALEG